MRILQIYHIWPSLFGGVSRVVYQITKELSKMGHEIDVLTTNNYLNSKKWCEYKNGVNIYFFKLFSKRLSRQNIIIPNADFVSWIKGMIRNYDCIHLHGYRNLYNIIVNHYARKYNIPYVLQAHGSLPRIMMKRRLKQVYDVFFGYKLLKEASKLIALSQTEAQQYIDMGVPEDKIVIIPNGINLSKYSNLPPKGFFKKKFNISKNKKVILYLGRIHKTKRIDILVNAYAYLIKNMKYNDAILVIAGPDDGYLAKVKSLSDSLSISDSILFTGFISSKDKLKALIDADVFVTPSFYGFPITFLEACATATPIVTTTLGDVLDWIDGYVGYTTIPTYSDLTEAIYKIISDNELCEKFSKNCRNIVKSKFSLKQVVEKLEKEYGEIS